MVINEKALLSRMKEAYKSGGYVIAVQGCRHFINGGSWAVSIDSGNLPRDVVGLLATHMGFLPDSGAAYRITKAKEGPQIQNMIFEDVHNLISELVEDSVGIAAQKTGVTLDGHNVWQRNIGLGIELIRPENEELFCKKDLVRLTAGEFVAVGEISRVWVMRIVTDPDDVKIRCLSGIRWTA